MFIYLFSFAICLIFHHYADETKSKVIKYILVFTPLIWLALVAGFRDYGVGTDTEYYSEEYLKDASRARGISDLLNNNNIHISNKGYLFLNYVGVHMMSDIFIEWFLTELLILICTYVAILKLKNRYRINLLLFSLLYLFAFYNVSLNIMRQMCAISICLLSFAYYLEKRKVVSLLYLLLATTFHTSAAIFALTFFYYFLSKSSHKWFVLVSVTGCLFIGILFYYQLLELLGKFGVFSEIYMDRYGASSEYEGLRVPYAFVCVSATIFFGIFLGYKNKICDKRTSHYLHLVSELKKRLNENNLLFFLLLAVKCKKKLEENSSFFFLLLVHGTFTILMMLNLLANTLIRISFYFYALDLVYMAFLLSSKKIPLYYKILLPSVIIFQWGYNYMYLNGNATYPYRSSFLGF